MTRRGAVLEFRSPIDGALHPAAVCATDDGTDPMPLILDVSPGAIADLPGSVAVTERIVEVAAAAGLRCIALRPTGRGPGTVYQDYGAVDTFEAIEHVATQFPVDRDAITVSGFSMGGAATWYLLAHYPDAFAAGAPFCGYADYRLWAKPGGLAFPMRPWEEASWIARSGAFLVPSIDRVPLWVLHGAWDRAVGGGVSVEHSRAMVRALEARGAPVSYTEIPGVGHDLDRTGVWEDVVRWLLVQRRSPDPDRVALAIGTLRHNRSRWVTIEQTTRSGEIATVDAEVGEGGVLRVATGNVRTLTLGPRPEGRPVTSIAIDGATVDAGDLSGPVSVRRSGGGAWGVGAKTSSAEKHHGQSGPIGDVFFERTVLVPGTIGDDEATFFTNWVAENAAEFYRARNGGVHRGGIQGVNWVDLPVVRDVDLSAADRVGANLILFGTPATNAILRHWADRVPFEVGPGRLRLADREWHDPSVAAIAAFPHPEHPERIVVVHGGATPDALTWGSHVDLALLPDYLVYARGETLAWGFWTNDWRAEPAEEAR